MNADRKSAMQSKKFIFAFTTNLLWLLIIGLSIVKGIDPEVQIALVYSSAFCQGLYLGGQSAVDAIVRYASERFKQNPIKNILNGENERA